MLRARLWCFVCGRVSTSRFGKWITCDTRIEYCCHATLICYETWVELRFGVLLSISHIIRINCVPSQKSRESAPENRVLVGRRVCWVTYDTCVEYCCHALLSRHIDLIPDMGGTETRRTVVNFSRYKKKLCVELEIQTVRARESCSSGSACVFGARRLRPSEYFTSLASLKNGTTKNHLIIGVFLSISHISRRNCVPIFRS